MTKQFSENGQFYNIDPFTIDHWVDRTDYIQDNYLFFLIKPQINTGNYRERVNYIIGKLPHKNFFLCPVDLYDVPYPQGIKILKPIDLGEYHQLIEKKYNQRPNKIIGVTGSSGKTSTVNFLYQMYPSAAFIGTNKCSVSMVNYTPDSPISTLGFYEFLHKSAENFSVAVIECSSYTIAQNRLGTIQLDGVIFTSFNEDHLDFHKSLLDYFLSKIQLINYLKPNGIVIINHNIKLMDSLLNLINKPVFLIENLWDFSNFYNQTNNIIFNKNIQNIPVAIDKSQVLVNNQWTFTIDNQWFWHTNNIIMAVVSYWLLENIIPDSFQWVPLEGRFKLIEKNNIKIMVDFCHSMEKVQYAIAMMEKYLATVGPRKIVIVIGIASKEISQRFQRILWLTQQVHQVILTLDNIHGDFYFQPYVAMMEEYPNLIFIENRQEAVKYAINHYGNGNYFIGCLGLGESSQLKKNSTVMDYNEYTFINNLLNDIII